LDIVTTQEPIVETYQPTASNEWGVDVDECLDVFRIDVGDEFEDPDEDHLVRESSTRPGKSQTYVHMTHSAVHIKTIYTDKANPQNQGDLK